MNYLVGFTHYPMAWIATPRITVRASTLQRACDKRGESLLVEGIARICIEEHAESVEGQTHIHPGCFKVGRIYPVISSLCGTKCSIEVRDILCCRNRRQKLFEPGPAPGLIGE